MTTTSQDEPIETRFREDFSRSIKVFGEINREMYHRLLPDILRLKAQSELPITIYIDSDGGDLKVAEDIIDTIHSESQKCPHGVGTVGVVSRVARSAAAVLFASCRYAICSRSSEILFHDISIPFSNGSINPKIATLTGDYLLAKSYDYAEKLAGNSIARMVSNMNRRAMEWKKHPTTTGKKIITEFGSSLRKIVTVGTSELVQMAEDESIKVVEAFRDASRLAKAGPAFEKEVFTNYMLQRITSISDGERIHRDLISEVTSTYLSLHRFFIENREEDHAFYIAFLHPESLLTDQENSLCRAQIEESGGEECRWAEEVAMDRAAYFWCFMVSLWTKLFSGENKLLPHEAFWLGACDEVAGCHPTLARRCAMPKPT